MTTPRTLLLLAGLTTLASLLASSAWACVPQPLLTLLPRASGAPGSQVTVDAVAVGDRAEIRWNGIDGPRLADGTGPSFSTAVTIPEVPPGLYSIVVIERQPDGSVGSTGRASFQVTQPDGQALPRTGDGAVRTTDASARGRSSPDPVPVALISGGAGLLLGAVGGAQLAHRRRRR